MDEYESAARSIEKEIKKVVNRVLAEVANEIQQEIAQRAVSDVYGVYEPKIYERRYTLDKPQNYRIDKDENNMSVSVTPVAEFNRAYGGWNYGDELGGFMNFGNYWHGYVTNYDHPMPRPYLSNYVEYRAVWDKIHQKLQAELGEWADVVDFNVYLGDG